MRKRNSAEIRLSIGSLIYEQQIYQNTDNDEMMDRTQAKIDNLRCELLSVEKEEKKIQSDIEDHG